MLELEKGMDLYSKIFFVCFSCNEFVKLLMRERRDFFLGGGVVCSPLSPSLESFLAFFL